jgi:opacity protein-like surface antigen
VYDTVKFEDVYRNDYNLGTEFDYAFTPQLTAFGRYNYSAFSGKTRQLGEFTADSGVTTPVQATFSDTDTQEFDVGARYTFMPSSHLQPFVGLALGTEHLSATHADFEGQVGLVETQAKLGDAEDVFHQRAEAGLQYAATSNLGFRLSVAASHVNTETKSNDPNLASIGLGPVVSHSADHWDYPIELGAVAYF